MTWAGQGFTAKSWMVRDRVSVAPQCAPVTLAEVKSNLRLTNTQEDAYLGSLILVATDLMQEYTQRKFIQQTMEGWLDIATLMSTWWEGSIVASINAMFSLRTIELPWFPAISVTSVTVYDQDDNATLVSASTYRVDVVDKSMAPRITLKESVVWPGGAYRNQNSMQIVWLAGYDAGSLTPTDAQAQAAVPVGLKQAVLMMTCYLYNNRGDCSGDCVSACGAKSLAQPYVVYSL
jgi:uncharacterized phiE125 gp8 family phage protein